MKKEALEKLTKELEAITNGVNSSVTGGKEKTLNEQMIEMMKQQSTILIRHIMKRCVESEALCQDVLQNHKTWERCMKYVTEKARAFAVNQVACIPDSIVFEWAEDYFHLDDKEEVEKEMAERAKKKAEAEKRKAEEAERETLARKEAITILSMTEGWEKLPEEEKEKKIKEKARDIKYQLGKKKPAKKAAKTKKSAEEEKTEEVAVDETVDEEEIPEEETSAEPDDVSSVEIDPEDDGEQMDFFSMGIM